jgi:cation diffusion facilitator family transporter
MTEARVLYVSIASTAVLGAIGLAWGIAVGSQMILLDGVYAVIGIALSWLLVRASALARQGPTRNFPYGREAATPLVIGVQGFVLAATLVYAAVEGVATIRLGGSDVAAGWAVAYGAVAAVGSLATWAWIRSVSGHSDLLHAEAAAWRVAALRGVGMVVGFGLMAALDGSRWESAAPYVDPAMVLVTCVAFIGTPLRMLRTTIVELLEGSPPDALQLAVREIVGDVERRFRLAPVELRMTKIGPKLYVEIDGVVDPLVTVSEEHEVRTVLREALERLPYEVWLNVELLPRTVAP